MICGRNWKVSMIENRPLTKHSCSKNCSLPESWKTLVVMISNSVPDGVVSMSQVTSSLLNEEMKRKSTGSYSKALVVKPRGRSRGRSPPHTHTHNRDQSRGSSRGRSPSKQDIECHYCKKKGHMKWECIKLKFKEENHAKQGEKKQDNTTAVSSDGELMIVCDESCVNLEGDFGCVQMGNEGLSKIVGRGNICLKASVGCKLLLKDVRHVPDIRLNLISTGKLDDEGYNNHFDQAIKDFGKDEQPEEIASDLVDLEPIPSPSTYGKNEEDVQPPLEVGENVDVPSEVELENEGKQSIQEPQPQLELRRFVRDKQPSRKYSPDEFVTITEQGEPESYQEGVEHDKKGE
ncbi:hypothetical protein RHGRI_005121 [Rhododendron griersonianum]|uniref:Retrovirus-related Pol polyprotein from transposon TNT 1-94-like beta-barrel domain-containing protein n=1 Tax=Rhododendron griersonianum TaxID=479676 RepID=A0AAV6LDU1_9ERIC|nr:hypothetical protein RHGRI_005121 [Rhododendron griersonianum]